MVIVPFSNVVLVAPDTLEPIAMFVVEPLRPPVPTFTVLVLPVVVAPEPRPVVEFVAAEPKVLVGAEKMLFAVQVLPLLTAGIVPVAAGIV